MYRELEHNPTIDTCDQDQDATEDGTGPGPPRTANQSEVTPMPSQMHVAASRPSIVINYGVRTTPQDASQDSGRAKRRKLRAVDVDQYEDANKDPHIPLPDPNRKGPKPKFEQHHVKDLNAQATQTQRQAIYSPAPQQTLTPKTSDIKETNGTPKVNLAGRFIDADAMEDTAAVTQTVFSQAEGASEAARSTPRNLGSRNGERSTDSIGNATCSGCPTDAGRKRMATVADEKATIESQSRGNNDEQPHRKTIRRRLHKKSPADMLEMHAH